MFFRCYRVFLTSVLLLENCFSHLMWKSLVKIKSLYYYKLVRRHNYAILRIKLAESVKTCNTIYATPSFEGR